MKPSTMLIPSGHVLGFNEEHQIIMTTENGHEAMVFTDVDQVEEFMNDYADCGYGLTSDNYELVELM